MSSSESPAASPSCQTLLQSFLQIDGLPFADILTEQDCQQLFCQSGLATDAGATPQADDGTLPQAELPPPTADPDPTRATVHACLLWTPVLTLWTFLHQVLSTSKSCMAAVRRAVVLLTELGCARCSETPGAYSKARDRLPQELLQDLTLRLGRRLPDACPQVWSWLGHRVLLVDGWVVTLPDTAANQQAYPQPKSQKKGLVFPQVRLVGLFALACNILVEVRWGPCQGKRTGETALLRDIFAQLRPGDVLVADRYYCSYFLIWAFASQGPIKPRDLRHFSITGDRNWGCADVK